MRPVRSIVLGFFAVVCAVAAAAGVPAAVAETGLYVDIRASDDAAAPVVERWKLYGASYALVIGIDNYTGGWPRLSNAIKDARFVAEEFGRRGFEVELLIDVTGIWAGFASLLKAWCGSGKRRFDLTLRIENGRISGGDPDGAYKVKGEVDEQGRFKNAFLNNLEMLGSLTDGRIQSKTLTCNGVLKLKRVAED